MKSPFLQYILFSSILLSTTFAFAQDDLALTDYFPEIKILESNDPAPGYYFINSKRIKKPNPGEGYIAIVDNYGTFVYFKLMPGGKSSMRLIEDGRIVFYHGTPRVLQFMDENLQIVDTIASRGYRTDGHDWDISEEGNILLLAKDSHIMDLSQLVEGGQSEVEVVDFVVQEFDKDKNLLYTWKTRDHFDILDAHSDIYTLADYTDDYLDYIHANSVHFDSDTSFLISSRHLNEITKVDRRTQEIIWRLGGKNNDFTFVNDDLKFSHQHSVSRTPQGTILLFDNGNGRDVEFSSAIEYELDEVNMTATLLKRYRRIPGVYTSSAGNTQQIHNENILVGWAAIYPSITEFHPDGSVALEYDFSDHSNSNRTEKFLWETKVFETNVDTLDFGRFDGSNLLSKILKIKNNADHEINITSYSTHSSFFKVTTELPLSIAPNEIKNIEIVFDPLTSDWGHFKDVLTLNYDTDTQRIARQVWLYGAQQDNVAPMAQITPNGSEVAIDSAIIIQLSEPIKKQRLLGTKFYQDNLDYKSIDDFIIFKYDNAMGTDVPFDATISTDKMTIKIFPDEPLLENQQYYVAIKNDLSDLSNNSLSYTSAFFTTGEQPVGIDDPDDTKDEIAVFPNPTTGPVYINSTVKGMKFIFVYDLFGKLLHFEKSERVQIEINLQDFNDGQYIVLVKDNKNNVLKRAKIIKN